MENSTWEDWESLLRDFPSLHLEDKVASLSGGVDMTMPRPNSDMVVNRTSKKVTPAQVGMGRKGKEVIAAARENPKRETRLPSKFNDYVVGSKGTRK